MDRRKPEAKRIWIMDATNAHFHEDTSTIPWKSRIFVDVGLQLRRNIGYLVKCECPSTKGGCKCGDDWTIEFIRCKDLIIPNLPYPQIVDEVFAGVANTSFVYHFKKFVNDELILEGQEDADPTYFYAEELIDIRDEMWKLYEESQTNGVKMGPVMIE